jgi:carboxymethylenebutenolidase
MGHQVQLKSADGFMFPVYVAEPDGQPRGGVVVVPEIFGVNSHIRAVADGFAAEGYLAVAPATFERVQRGVELGYRAHDRQAGAALKKSVESLATPGVLPDLQAAVQHAAHGGKVGIVGYCWGGLLAWRAACELDGLSAAVTYYGGGMTSEAEAARTPRVPLLAHFGERDQLIPLEGVEAFRKAHPEVELHLYPAGHGFNCDQRDSWDEEAARLARERTLAFFAKHLG